MNKVKAAWADFTWNPVTGCSPVGEGCEHCYAEKVARRFNGKIAGDFSNPNTRINPDPFKVTLHPDRLYDPLRRRKPAKIFVCSMSDLFHPDVPFEFIAQIFSIMAFANQHTFMVLTKRPERTKAFFEWCKIMWIGLFPGNEPEYPIDTNCVFGFMDQKYFEGIDETDAPAWPLPNVWLGVTAEDQARADERIRILESIPAAKRFVSYEPALGPIDVQGFLDNGTISWIIAGGETGPGARECREEWIKGIYDQCQAAGVPFFFKQTGKIWVKGFNSTLVPVLYGRHAYNTPEQWMQRREWPK